MSKTKKVFLGGMNMDASPYSEKKEQYSNARNVQLLDYEGDNLVITNLEGNTERFSLSEGFTPLAAKEFGGILYILSANHSTGAGEVGTYPSPTYTGDGVMEQNYKPLNNYDTGAGASPFSTTLFNFPKTEAVEMELQPSFDNTVNIIFTDNTNPPRIINSGFSVTPDLVYSIPSSIELYTPSDFDTRINLILRNNVPIEVSFEHQVLGGELNCGNYQYFFTYATDSGDETEVIGWSFTVPVGIGSNVTNLRGGLPNEPSNKSNLFRLSNLNQDYEFVKVYFSYSSGESENVDSFFEVENRYRITTDSLEILHTGAEEVNQVSRDIINRKFIPISQAKTITQTNNILFLGNITESTIDLSELEEVSRRISIVPRTKKLTMWNRPKLSSTYGDIVGTSSATLQGDTYPAGHANPKNVHDFLGYWPNENYTFGVRYLIDGYLTPVFPVSGNALQAFTGISDEAYSGSITDYENNAGFHDNYLDPTPVGPFLKNDFGRNILGVQGFPDFDKSNIYTGNPTLTNFMQAEATDTYDEFYILHPEFQLSYQGSPLADYVLNDGRTLSEATQGIVFVRQERKKDVLCKGIQFPALAVNPVNDNTSSNEATNKLLDLSTGEYFIPAPTFRYECWDSDNSLNSPLGEGAFFQIYGDSSGLPDVSKRRTAFYSADMDFEDNGLFSTLNNKSPYVVLHYPLFSDPTDPTLLESFTLELLSDFGRFPVGAPFTFLRIGRGEIVNNLLGFYPDSPTYWTLPVPVPNGGNFVGEKVNRVLLQVPDFPIRKAELYALFNPYLGVILSEGSNLFPELYPTAGDPGEEAVIQESYDPAANLTISGRDSTRKLDHYDGTDSDRWVGMYSSIYLSNPRSMNETKARHEHIQQDSYFPISGIIKWEDIVDNTVDCYNGDAYVSTYWKRIFFDPVRNSGGGLVSSENYNYSGESTTGFHVPLVHESNYNPAYRLTSDPEGAEPEDRSFAIYNGKDSSSDDFIASRSYLQLESRKQNYGYGKVGAILDSFSTDILAPFIKSRFVTRIAHSNRFAFDSFVNAYRQFEGLNFVDYDIAKNQITSIKANNQAIYMVQEAGIGIVGLNQREIIGNATAGSLFIQNSEVLAPQAKYISDRYGSQDQLSVLDAESGIYGFDRFNRKLWRITNNGLELISDNSVDTFLIQMEEAWTSNTLFSYDDKLIFSGYNPRRGQVVFSFLHTNDNPTPDYLESLVYNERLGMFTSFADFQATLHTNYKDLVTFQGGTAYEHSSPNRNTFGGIIYPSSLTHVVNENPDFTKSLDSFQIISNVYLPETLTFTTEDQESVLDNSTIDPLIGVLPIKYRDKKYEGPVPKTSSIEDLGIDWDLESRIRDQWIRVKIDWENSQELLVLYSVLYNYRISYS